MKKNYTKAEKPVPCSINGDNNFMGEGNIIGDNNLLLFTLPNKYSLRDVLQQYNLRNMCDKNLNTPEEKENQEPDKLLNDCPTPQVLQTGEHSKLSIINITHTGEGDIISSDTEINQLRAKVETLQQLVKEKDKTNEAKDEEIKTLKEELNLLKRSSSYS